MVTTPDPDRAVRIAGAYDAVAELYAEMFADPTLASEVGDRVLLDRFAARILATGGRRTADLGCGPGHASAYLTAAGLEVHGYDVSPAMIKIATAAHPDLTFHVGSLDALPDEDDSLDGALVRFSIIHTPPVEVPGHLSEVARVLCTGGAALISFQATDDVDLGVESFDHRVITGYRWHPDRMSGLLGEAGLTEVDRLVNPVSEGHRFPEAHLLLAKV
ncbi:MAG: class I SAM-dependent methyltransferase [Propionibacteriaceae bacterium]